MRMHQVVNYRKGVCVMRVERVTHSSFRIFQHYHVMLTTTWDAYGWVWESQENEHQKHSPNIMLEEIFMSVWWPYMRESERGNAVSKKEWNQHRQNIYRPFSLLHKLKTIWTISLISSTFNIRQNSLDKLKHEYISPWNYYYYCYWKVIFASFSFLTLHTDDYVKYVVIWMCSTKMSKLAIIIAFNHFMLRIISLSIDVRNSNDNLMRIGWNFQFWNYLVMGGV